MIYDFKNLKLEINNNTGTLYKDDKLMFRGDSYISIKMFLSELKNDQKNQQKHQEKEKLKSSK